MNPEDIPLNRLYGDLSFLWPLVSAPEDYAEEASHWRTIIREKRGPGRHRILELGVGGGHNLSHLTAGCTSNTTVTSPGFSPNRLGCG